MGIYDLAGSIQRQPPPNLPFGKSHDGNMSYTVAAAMAEQVMNASD
ncbi:hypothetical protein [Laspinema palackyanum]|nr:hypothetical protein [Laspinema sp. D2c]